jgi:hypothetical protein
MFSTLMLAHGLKNYFLGAYMLKNINPILNADVLYALRAMGL